MSINELLQSVQFITNTEGEKTAILIDMDSWEKILIRLEDSEDAYELEQAKQEQDEIVSWDIVIDGYSKAHPDAKI